MATTRSMPVHSQGLAAGTGREANAMRAAPAISERDDWTITRVMSLPYDESIRQDRVVTA